VRTRTGGRGRPVIVYNVDSGRPSWLFWRGSRGLRRRCSKRRLHGKCSRWGFGRARRGGEWIPASNAARPDGSRLSGRVTGGVGRRRRGGVLGGEGALADEFPIVGEDAEDSQGSICYQRAADQVAVEHAQDAAPGTGDPGAAREGVGGLAHPGEL